MTRHLDIIPWGLVALAVAVTIDVVLFFYRSLP